MMDLSDIEISMAQNTDIDDVISLRLNFISEYSNNRIDDLPIELCQQLHEYFSVELNVNYFCCLAKYNNQAIACVGMHIRQLPGNLMNFSGKWAYIMSVYTLPEFRRKGISSKLLNIIMNDAKSKGIHTFELHATHDGEPMYIKEGFQIHKEPTYRKIIK